MKVKFAELNTKLCFCLKQSKSIKNRGKMEIKVRSNSTAFFFKNSTILAVVSSFNFFLSISYKFQSKDDLFPNYVEILIFWKNSYKLLQFPKFIRQNLILCLEQYKKSLIISLKIFKTSLLFFKNCCCTLVVIRQRQRGLSRPVDRTAAKRSGKFLKRGLIFSFLKNETSYGGPRTATMS